jgi:hypothetical protein
MKQQITFYKIKDFTTGLYSGGGLTPVFNKRGKAWNNLGHVKSHLIGIKKNNEVNAKQHWAKTYEPVTMTNWVVEEFVFEQKDCREIPLAELIISAGLF